MKVLNRQNTEFLNEKRRLSKVPYETLPSGW